MRMKHGGIDEPQAEGIEDDGGGNQGTLTSTSKDVTVAARYGKDTGGSVLP